MAWSVWPGFSCGQPGGRELAQLVVDERQQSLGGLRVALLDGGQDAGDVGHDRQSYHGPDPSAAAIPAGGSRHGAAPARPAAHRSGRRSSTRPAGSDGSRAKASRR